MKVRLAILIALTCAGVATAGKLTTSAVRFCLSSSELEKAWPASAKARGLAGEAVIRCTSKTSDRFEDCIIESEKPAGEGFGEAALKLVSGARAEAATINGVKQQSVVRIRAPFSGRTFAAIGPTAPLLTDVEWTAAPTPRQMIAAYPFKARGLGEDAAVRMICTVATGGALTSCIVNSEQPGGQYGFADAALRLAPYFRAAGQTRSGRPTDGARISFMVRFPRSLDKRKPAPVKPTIIAGPTAVDLANAFTQDATLAKYDQGRIILECVVGPTGKADGCKARPFSPADQPFANASLKLAPLYDLSLWEDGNPAAGAPIELPVYFVKPTSGSSS